MSWKHTEEWRWDPDYHRHPSHRSIAVIDRHPDEEQTVRERTEGARRVPEPQPLTQADWDGDGA